MEIGDWRLGIGDWGLEIEIEIEIGMLELWGVMVCSLSLCVVFCGAHSFLNAVALGCGCTVLDHGPFLCLVHAVGVASVIDAMAEELPLPLLAKLDNLRVMITPRRR